MDKPLILVTNDDGIDSEGLYKLVKELNHIGNVVVVAPDHQQSAVGHSLSIAKPLRINKFHRNGVVLGYAINGSPTDCVKLALSTILDNTPDLIVSGINYGQNTSINILYSGTVAAATEGYLVGIPSVAVSLTTYDTSFDSSYAAILTTEIIRNYLNFKGKFNTLLNVNIPALPKEKIKGIKITKCSNSYWNDKYERRIDPFGREYFWFAGEYCSIDDDPDSDDWALKNGYVSITPIRYSFTDFELIEKLQKWDIIESSLFLKS